MSNSLLFMVAIENPVLLHLLHEVVHAFVAQLLLEVCVLEPLPALLVQGQICHFGLAMELRVLVLLFPADLGLPQLKELLLVDIVELLPVRHVFTQ